MVCKQWWATHPVRGVCGPPGEKIWRETKVNYCDFTVFVVLLHFHFYNVDPLLFVMTDKIVVWDLSLASEVGQVWEQNYS